MNYLDMTIDTPGSFRLCKAVKISDYARDIDKARCDYHGWGPVAIDWTPEYGKLFGTGAIENVFNLRNFDILVDCAPYFYITFNEIVEQGTPSHAPESSELQEKAWLERPEAVAPTLGHLMRLIIEWASVFEEPFYNDEPSARLSHEVLSLLSVDNSVKSAIMSAYPEMPVARYLRGDVNAKDVPIEGDMTTEVKDFMQVMLSDFAKRPANPDMWQKFYEL